MAGTEKENAVPEAPEINPIADLDKVPEFVAQARKRIGRIGRPPKDVDEKDVELLASCLAPKTIVARRLGISVDTLNRRFLEAYQRGLDTAKMELWFSQFVSATVRGNVRMQIHLGVNYLGQKTGYQAGQEDDSPDPDRYADHEPEEISRDELMALAKMGLKKLKGEKPKGKNGGALDAGEGGRGDLKTGRGNGEPDRFH